MEVTLLSETKRVANMREHISWSHKFALFWLALSLVFFGGAYALAEANRTPFSSQMQSGKQQAWPLARIENLILPRQKLS